MLLMNFSVDKIYSILEFAQIDCNVPLPKREK